MTSIRSFRRILHVVDPSVAASPGLTRSIDLAKSVGAELWLALYDVGPRPGILAFVDRAAPGDLQKILRDQMSARLEDLARTVREEHGLTVQLIDEAVPLEASRVVKDVVRLDIDLVVKDAGHVSLIRRLVTLPVDWDLLRTCPSRVWLVAASRDTNRLRIAAAVDPLNAEHGAGRLNNAILDTAHALAIAAEEDWRVFSVFSDIPTGLANPGTVGSPIPEPYEELRGRHLASHREAFAALLVRHEVPDSHGELLFGRPCQALIDAATSAETDVLVVGVMRRRGLDRMLIGSTAERLIARAPCDVLAVPHPPPAT